MKTYEVQILTHVAQGQLLEAVQLGLKVVKLLGVNIPDSPNEADIQQKFADVSSLYVDKDILEFTKLPQQNFTSTGVKKKLPKHICKKHTTATLVGAQKPK